MEEELERAYVVNCFQICIFELLETAARDLKLYL